jgi:hypothetical protein
MQMKKHPKPEAPPPTLVSDVIRFALAAVFIAMTMAFILVPYALTSHPGEAPQATSASVRHVG